MKAMKITLILVVMFSLIAWVRRSGVDFGHAARIMPFCSGNSPSLFYDIGGVVLIVLCLWALSRVKIGSEEDDWALDDEDEVVEPEEVDEG